jgi:hypothetical protein
VLHSGTRLSRADVRYYVEGSVDLFVQLDRAGGARMIRSVVLAEPRTAIDRS